MKPVLLAGVGTTDRQSARERIGRGDSEGEESRRALPPRPKLGTAPGPHTARRGAPHANGRRLVLLLPPLKERTWCWVVSISASRNPHCSDSYQCAPGHLGLHRDSSECCRKSYGQRDYDACLRVAVMYSRTTENSPTHSMNDNS